MTTKETFVCGSCGNECDEEPYSFYEDEPICETCAMNEEPDAIVYYGDDEEPSYVMRYSETDDNFRCTWVSTSGWRGYMRVSSDTYTNVQNDAVLAYSADARELEAFDEMLRKYCDERGIRYARVFTQTSNVFCQGYDFFVHNDDVEDFKTLRGLLEAVSNLRDAFRDETRFTMTALTGKDEFDENDVKLAKAYAMLKEGADFDDVMDEIMGE